MEINHEMQNYDFVEGTEFEGLMPKAIAKIGGIGAGNNVPESGRFARGVDPMEVVDVHGLAQEDL